MKLNGLKGKLVRSKVFLRVTSWLTRNTPRIFMYHRFSTGGDLTVGKIDSPTFMWQMEQLSRGWNVMTLREYSGVLRKGERLPSYTVVLTIDDGYRDFYMYAYPLLKKNALKATFFPSINFLDGKWLWWDRINYVLDKTQKKDFFFEFSGKCFKLDLTTYPKRVNSWSKLSNFCTGVDNDVKWEMISKLEKDLEVKLPPSPPEEYQAISWDELKEVHGNGIEIGSHTLDHPIMSKISMETLRDELAISKDRLEGFLGSEVESFCYPNGMPDDINDTVCENVENAGYKAAVVSYNHLRSDRYRMPRMGADSDRGDFLWKLCGMETLVQRLKRRSG